MLKRGHSILREQDFATFEDWEVWRSAETSALERLIELSTSKPPMSIQYADNPNLDTICITVIEAKGLLPKDKASGSNNPYCVVQFRGRTFVSNVVRNSVNPTWMFTVPLIMWSSDDVVSIGVWNRPTVNMDKIQTAANQKQAFLGACVFTAQSLIACANNPERQSMTVPLSKRSKRSHLSIFRDTCTKLCNTLNYSLGTFFNAATGNTQTSSKDLEVTTVMLSAMQTSSVITGLELDVDVCEHASGLLTTFYSPLAGQLEEFAQKYVAASPDMSDVFDLYKAVRRLQDTCEAIDFRIADGFPVTRWFRPFLREWLSRSEIKMRDWIAGALQIDNCKRISDTIPYSSSILDVFTSFQQQIDFVCSLNWPNSIDHKLIFMRLLYEVCNCLSHYSHLTRDKIEQEFTALKVNQPVARRVTQAQIGNIKIRIKQPAFMARRKKRPAPADQIIHYRFSSEACVRLSNIQSLLPRFMDLVRNVPRFDLSANLPYNSSKDELTYGDTRYAITLQIMSALHVMFLRPWTAQLSCRIYCNNGREVGRTHLMQQASTITWNCVILAVLSEREILGGLNVRIVQHVPGQPDAAFAVGKIQFDSIGDVLEIAAKSKGTTLSVSLNGPSSLLVNLAIDTNIDFEFIVSLAEQITTRNLGEVVDMFVDQLCFDLRDRIHPVTLRYKTQAILDAFNKSKLMFKKTAPNDANAIDMEELASDIAPILDFLDANLDVMAENVDGELAFRMAGHVWDRVVSICEAMIVPSLGEDPKERKPWDEKRMMFFRKFIEVGRVLCMKTVCDPNQQLIRSEK
eukprot:jgi/Hompol1/4822/HPOL_003991-RA